MTIYNDKRIAQTIAIIVLIGTGLLLNVLTSVLSVNDCLHIPNLIIAVITATTATCLFVQSKTIRCDGVEDVMEKAEENFHKRCNSILLALVSVGFFIWAL